MRFHKVTNEHDLTQIINQDMGQISRRDANLILAYQGVCLSMMAEHKFSPFSKLDCFVDGKMKLEKSISNEQLVENTYLRLLVQLSIPKYLGYHQNIESDLLFLKHNLRESELSVAWKLKFIETLIATNSERSELDSLKNIYFE